MPTYRVITQLYYGSDQLSFNNCYIDAISPSQAMRKHKLPKLKPNQEIIINILPVDKGGASPSSSIDEYYETINNKSPSDFVDLSPKLKLFPLSINSQV